MTAVFSYFSLGKPFFFPHSEYEFNVFIYFFFFTSWLKLNSTSVVLLSLVHTADAVLLPSCHPLLLHLVQAFVHTRRLLQTLFGGLRGGELLAALGFRHSIASFSSSVSTQRAIMKVLQYPGLWSSPFLSSRRRRCCNWQWFYGVKSIKI